ncbi:ABC transporter substrate-binding protein [Fulvimarina sp. 2208YS6-2-32]|uniref:ABC transporter substrate-binding protein n=1 Tax=Fulvimarina uroteuthidis TaxID=3098149 RepID=A0ABU5I6C1_9HYPH|nr:ABC transporter substrate-binding protein [Fulvimarina sp. 2208YS6-2-32]MDY8110303.1 ABC transporter substrate-binding protein [Fulvimarina sp. 2208YS6-2-32]
MTLKAFLLAVAFIGLAGSAPLSGPSGRPGASAQERVVLQLWSATDRDAIESIIERFEVLNPAIDIVYTEFNTAELHQAVLEADTLPDLVISSAMDLQIDLVNDGYAVSIENMPDTPDWSRWRGELFGFTREPVALVYDRKAFENRPLPTSRSDLATMLRDDPAFFDGRLGTYDVALSGVGYMFATQDAQRGYQASRLVESLGRARTRLYCCTGEMIDDVASGRLVLAYNVIGSYASRMVADDPRLGLLLLSDYALVFTRSVFVTKGSDHQEEAKGFVRFLLSPEGQAQLAEHSFLAPLVGNDPDTLGDPFEGSTALLPIRLRPGLLTWLDDRKKERFMRDWHASIGTGEDRAPAATVPFPSADIPLAAGDRDAGPEPE